MLLSQLIIKPSMEVEESRKFGCVVGTVCACDLYLYFWLHTISHIAEWTEGAVRILVLKHSIFRLVRHCVLNMY